MCMLAEPELKEMSPEPEEGALVIHSPGVSQRCGGLTIFYFSLQTCRHSTAPSPTLGRAAVVDCVAVETGKTLSIC